MTEENNQPAELQPSVVALKTGEKLITILQEAFEGEGEERKGICLIMNFPYELSLSSAPNPENPERDLQVKFSKWCPYAIESQYRIPYDVIMTVATPDPGLAQAYRAKIEANQASTPEQAAAGFENTPNWQQQQQLVQQAIADASVPTVTPEVV